MARQEGVAASLLFQWRKLERQGALTAVSAGEAVVPASDLGLLDLLQGAVQRGGIREATAALMPRRLQTKKPGGYPGLECSGGAGGI